MKVPRLVNRALRAVGLELRAAGIGEGASLGYAGEALAGVHVTEKTALAFTAVYAAINVLSRDTACLPLAVQRRLPAGGRERAEDDPRDALVYASPDGESTSKRWRQALMGHVLGWGNGYAEIERDGRGMPAALHLLHPRETRPERSRQTRRLYYSLDNGRTLAPENVLHVAGLGFDGLCGYSPIRLAREAVGLGLAAEAFGATLFGNGSHPKGVLKTPQTLKPEAQERLRQQWSDRHSGPYSAHRPAILEQGMEWQSISIPPEDAQFLATRQFQVIEIARLYSLPPHKLGDYSQSHLANIEASNLDYLTTSLMPWLVEIEQEFTRKLFAPEERLFVKHNMAALLRGDMNARSVFYTRMRDLGVHTPNLIAELEDLNPIGPVGDKRLVPLNMTTLDQAGSMLPSKSPQDKGKANGRAAHHRNGLPS